MEKHECEFYLVTDVAVHVCECGNITVSDKSESKEYVEESKCAKLIAALEEAIPVIKESVSEYKRLLDNEKHPDAIWALSQVQEQQQELLVRIESLISKHKTQ